MAPSFPVDITRTILKDDLTLAYAGEFRDTLTDRIIELSEIYLSSDETISKLRKKASFLVAECFQNVIRHGSKEAELIFDSPRRVESFVIRFYDKKCFILSENAIPNSSIGDLKSMLEDVNSIPRDQLRDMYIRLLAEAELSEKGGAGLGLIEMARRSGNKLQYSFQPIDNGHSIFHFMLVLEHAKEREEEPDYAEEFKEIEGMLMTLKKENHFLVYHGEFDREFNDPVSEMIERNLDAQARPLALKVKYYNAALLIMQLIAEHSADVPGKRDGLISLGITGDGYKIHSTCHLTVERKEKIENVLLELRKYGTEHWNNLFEKEHRDFVRSLKEEFADIYLQLVRISRSWDYNFKEAGGVFEFNFQVEV